MNLKRYILLPLLLVLLLSGCSASEFNNNMQKAKDAVAESDYEKAKTYFTMAVDEKNKDKEANSLLKQTRILIDVINRADQEDFNGAISKCKEVINIESESGIIKDKATELNKQYSAHIKEVDSLKSTLQNNLIGVNGTFEAGKYDDCIIEADKVLEQINLYNITFKDEIEELNKIKEECEEAKKRIEQEEIEKAKQIEEEKKRKEAQQDELEAKGKIYEQKVSQLISQDNKVSSENKKVKKIEKKLELVSDAYKRWDNLLNEIHNDLMQILDDQDRIELEKDRDAWVNKKVQLGEAESKDVKNENQAKLKNIEAQTIETANRCKYLLNVYMNTSLTIK